MKRRTRNPFTVEHIDETTSALVNANGFRTLIDREDVEWITALGLGITYLKAPRRLQYARFSASFPAMKKRGYPIIFHRAIMKHHGLLVEGLEVDHINNNPLDNRKANLRMATREENSRNKRGRENVSSKFKGVYWHQKSAKWTAIIGVSGENINLGVFEFEEDAARAYDIGCKRYHGRFGKCNFPGDVVLSADEAAKVRAFVHNFEHVHIHAKNLLRILDRAMKGDGT